MKIAIDAGHGGIDPGAWNNWEGEGIYEKNISLQLALLTGERLKKSDIQLLYLRLNDCTIFLPQRVADIRSFGADYLVSIHTAPSFSTKSQGIRSYYYGGSSEGRHLAQNIHQELIAATGRPDRGTRSGDLYLLREAGIPGCLIEFCFINNLEERLLLLDEQFLIQAADAIAAGIYNYLEPLKTASDTDGT